MLVMLTNDDGVRAEGLWALYREIASWEGTEVAVVAPEAERSATGHAVTLHRPLRAERVDLGPERGTAWEVNGTPADCVKLGVLSVLGRRPDLVLSGINRGPNLGIDVFYSGTVSAAMEAVLLGIPSVALSLAVSETLDYRPAARFALWLARRVAQKGLPPDSLLNVNVPSQSDGDPSGVTVTRLALARYRDSFERRVDPRGRAYYWLVAKLDRGGCGPDTDIGAISCNRISVTPLYLDLTHSRLRKELAAWDWPSPGADGGGGR